MIKKALPLTCFLVFALLMTGVSASPKVSALESVDGIISRISPEVRHFFHLELITSERGQDVYELESVADKVVLRGNNGVSLASAYYRYLQDFCGCQLSWSGDQVQIPVKLPKVPTKIRQVSTLKHRHFFNYCTYNYTASWWNWERWEREIDFLAMNGVNMPLTMIGVETVWYHTLIELGLNDDEARGFIASPVYVGWQWMSNLEGTGGPASRAWIDRRGELGRKILDRMRALGMTPIFHGFSGHVPRILKEKHPEARIDIKHGWARNAFKGAAQLDPTDPFFDKVGKIYFYNMDKYLGEGKYYMADPFHEGRPPSEEKEYLNAVGIAISRLLTSVSPEAIWAIQDWSMHDEIVKVVDKEKLLIMALKKHRWKEYKEWGYPFTTGVLDNFGGRTHLHGNLHQAAKNIYRETAKVAPNCTGIGVWLEGSEINPVFFELVLDMNWRKDSVDVTEWLHAWADRRYGARSKKAHQAWDLLLQGPYAKGGHGFSSMVAARPALAPVKSGPNRPLTNSIRYDTKDLVKAWSLLLEAKESLGDSAGYRYDVVDIGRQCLANLAQFYQRDAALAFIEKDREQLREKSARFLTLLKDIDRLVGTHELFSLGRWMQDAANWGSNEEESRHYQEYAAKLITVWGSDNDKWTLHDYGWREWSGLISHFYVKRWEMFWKEMDTILAEGKTYADPPMKSWGRQLFRANALYERMAEWELNWTKNASLTQFSSEAVGDPVKVAQFIFDAYKKDLRKLPRGTPAPWNEVQKTELNME